MNKEPFTLTIPADCIADAWAMLTHWERQNPWKREEAKRLEAARIALVYTLAAPSIPDVRSGAVAAKMLREALGRDI